MDESTRGRHCGTRHSADTTLLAGRPRQRMVVPSPVACMSGVPPDLVDAVPRLAALLQALPPERTEVGFDELRLLCLSAITAAREEGAPVTLAAAERPLGEAASVLAACVIYCSLRQGGQWWMSRDRRERLHPVAELVQALVPDTPE